MGNGGKPPADRFGKYRLVKLLATGGMAELFYAFQQGIEGFEKPVVIKRILPALARNKRFIKMLFDEARIVARLNHKNIVQILDLGCINGQYFIAMEYLEGESLAVLVDTCLRSGLGIPRNLVVAAIAQAAEGLHHAHTMTAPDGRPLNIIHRDVSPQNIMVLYTGVVKVIDFGVARAVGRVTETRTGVLKGKLSYMSPELIQGKAIDARSDVFSLGVVLWECLLGRRLYEQESDLKVLESITSKDAPSPAVYDADVSEELCRITLRALARDRELRFQSALDFKSALSSYLKSAESDADPPAIGLYVREMFADRIEEKRHLTRRPFWRRWAVVGVALLVVLLGAGLYLSLGRWSGAGDSGEPTTTGAEAGDLSAGNPDQVVDEQRVAGNKKKHRARIQRRQKKKATPDQAGPPGKVRLMTTPWTDIYYRGRKIGQTPLVDVEFPPGTIRLRAVNKEAGIDRIITIRVKPGELVVKRHSFH